MIVAKKLHPYPLNLKSKVWNQGEKDGGYEHYLVFLEKREESRSFDVFLCFLGEKYGEKREEKCPKKGPNSSQKPNLSVLVQPRVLGAIYTSWHPF